MVRDRRLVCEVGELASSTDESHRILIVLLTMTAPSVRFFQTKSLHLLGQAVLSHMHRQQLVVSPRGVGESHGTWE
jgi:hypothetical protein